MRSLLWQSILLGFIAMSAAIYDGAVAIYDPTAIGVVRMKNGAHENDFGSGVVLGNGECVITAAHVVQGKTPGDLKVSMNKIEHNTITRTNTLVACSRIHIHPLYAEISNHQNPLPYDIAVVELESKMDTSPWKVAQSLSDYFDVTLSGWGSISMPPATFPAELRSTVNKNRKIGYWSQCGMWKNLDGAICIMNQSSSHPDYAPSGLNCHGDSGGPAVVGEYVVGVASESNGNCGRQTSGLLAALYGTEQGKFMRRFASKCGFKFGDPGSTEVLSDL